MSTDLATVEPGVYEGIPFEDYLAIDAESNSRLGLMEKSPAHYRANVSLKESDPLILGRLFHSGRLEPSTLRKRYAVMPKFELDTENTTGKGEPSQSKCTSYYKNRSAEFHHHNSDKEIVDDWLYQIMLEMVVALCESESDSILNCDGPTELTLVWIDDETGLLCKARIDKLARAKQAFADLKSVRDLSKFQLSMAYLGYHRQAAHYQAGWAKLNGGELLTPWFVAVEKSKPYCSMAAPIDEDTLIRGEERRRAALNRVAECRASNHWPGPPSPRTWRVPEWELAAGDGLELVFSGDAAEET